MICRNAGDERICGKLHTPAGVMPTPSLSVADTARERFSISTASLRRHAREYRPVLKWLPILFYMMIFYAPASHQALR